MHVCLADDQNSESFWVLGKEWSAAAYVNLLHLADPINLPLAPLFVALVSALSPRGSVTLSNEGSSLASVQLSSLASTNPAGYGHEV